MIKLVAFDFDGVFTNNMVYVDEKGNETVRCCRSDGIGLRKLGRLGIATVVISSEMNPVVKARCQKLGIQCIQTRDKLSALLALETPPQNTAFLGNDTNDLECLKAVWLPIVTRDAHPDVIPYAKYVTSLNGGEGAVREVCDLIEREYVQP